MRPSRRSNFGLSSEVWRVQAILQGNHNFRKRKILRLIIYSFKTLICLRLDSFVLW